MKFPLLHLDRYLFSETSGKNMPTMGNAKLFLDLYNHEFTEFIEIHLGKTLLPNFFYHFSATNKCSIETCYNKLKLNNSKPKNKNVFQLKVYHLCNT